MADAGACGRCWSCWLSWPSPDHTWKPPGRAPLAAGPSTACWCWTALIRWAAAAEATRFERAKQIARQIVNAGRQGDAFSLVLMADRPGVIIGAAAVDQAAVIREIDNLELTQAGADLPAAVAAVRRLVAGVAAQILGFRSAKSISSATCSA